MNLQKRPCIIRKTPFDILYQASNYITMERKTLFSYSTKGSEDVVKCLPQNSVIGSLFQKHHLDFEKFFYLEVVFQLLYAEKIKISQQQAKMDVSTNFGSSSNASNNNAVQSKESLKESQAVGGQTHTQVGKCPMESQNAESPKSPYQHHLENSAGNTEKWGENSLLESEIQEVTRRIASDPKQWGSIGGNLLQAILVENTPKIDWKAILKHFVTSVIDKFTIETRSKPNRRHGFDLPGQRHLFRSRVLMAIDVSGSMSEGDISKGLSLMAPFLKHADVSYCYWDCNCSDFMKIRKPQKQYDTVGGGDTDPQCIMNKMAEEKIRFDGLILFTDNYFHWERPLRGASKIAIISTDNACPPPPWVKHHIPLSAIIKD